MGDRAMTAAAHAGTALPDAFREKRIYVAGHRGLVGSAVARALAARGAERVITRKRAELDLTDAGAVRRFFAEERPELVFLCAAKVGGIAANDERPAEFIQANLAIQTNVIHEAWRNGVHDLVFMGSSCIYPRDCPQPIREDYLLTGPLEPTNRAYSVAKIAGVETCRAYNRQHGTRYVCLMPCNLFGPGDNYDPETSHVLAALIRKCHEAKVHGAEAITAWGTGTPRREHLHSDDVADAALFIATLEPARLDALLAGDRPPLVNVGAGADLTVAELAELVKEVVGFDGGVVWDRSRPDGTPRKLLDVSLLRSLGWSPRIELREGVRRAYEDFLAERAR